MQETLAHFSALNNVLVPDLWQQEAVRALRQGSDVVVQAPTGAGKTLIFELWSHAGKNRGQAIYTVPTRALANDKLAEWRARGWDVGIATGDLSDRLDAPVLVATLETQKYRIIQGDGPDLLVIDEYQMLSDPDRGLNYELAIALAPPKTQLLLLSGSVGNPQAVVAWLRRLGRRATLIRHDERPVPLEEVNVHFLNVQLPSDIRSYWPRFVAKALVEDLGPILIFAPRRQAAESIAAELARQLPIPNPLDLTSAQKAVVGEGLAKLLQHRIGFHHSGLSYAARAGVIEPLAKAGQLRVVVATMGLAAGINFSLRGVALAGDSYRRDEREQPLRSDEILQMFGRAGRRGIDETGYVLVSSNQIRLFNGRPCHLARNGLVDWSALLSVMQAAKEQGRDPFAEAVRVQERLFTTRPILLGIEHSLRYPSTPCGLKTDAERARHVRKRYRQFQNSRGEWESFPALSERPLKEVRLLHTGDPVAINPSPEPSRGLQPTSDCALSRCLVPVLTSPPALENFGRGELEKVGDSQEGTVYGRALMVAELLNGNRVLIGKWVRRLTLWHGRQSAYPVWQKRIEPLLARCLEAQKTPVLRFESRGRKIMAVVRLDELIARVPVDRHGVPLWKPPTREVFPPDCSHCSLVSSCQQLSTSTGVALLWRRLGLVDRSGAPAWRGRIEGFFSQGIGLAIAAALEEETYRMEDLIYDLANLDAGYRFCREENRWGGRLAEACRRAYGRLTVPGYLENGVPPKYGAGAEQVVASIHSNPGNKHGWITEILGPGDIDRALIEWRSLLRQIAHAPSLEWPRWCELQVLARATFHETESPTLLDLPPLAYFQTRRAEHRLVFRRY